MTMYLVLSALNSSPISLVAAIALTYVNFCKDVLLPNYNPENNEHLETIKYLINKHLIMF